MTRGSDAGTNKRKARGTDADAGRRWRSVGEPERVTRRARADAPQADATTNVDATNVTPATLAPPQPQSEMDSAFLLDLVVRKREPILKLKALADEALLVNRDARLVLNHQLQRLGS